MHLISRVGGQLVPFCIVSYGLGLHAVIRHLLGWAWEPLDEEVDPVVGHVVPVQRLLSEPRLEEILECDVGTFVCVRKFNVRDSPKSAEYLNKQKIISSLEPLVR